MTDDKWCLSLEVRLADEPAKHLTTLWPSLRTLLATLDDDPAHLFVTSPKGRTGRDRVFSWKTMEKLGADENTGTISAWELRHHQVSFDLSVYLRHNAALETHEQPPARIAMAVEFVPNVYAPPGLVDAAVAFLGQCAEHMPVLHGGITRLENRAQAAIETTGGGTDRAAQPDQFQRRSDFEWWMNNREIWTRCRRLYWTTLLGPDLTVALGGAEAARGAGAVDVHEINGSLLLRAMEGPPRDSLDPEFLAATTSLRRWLWPHTFQNPLDAAGFELEVGLPPPEL